MGSHTSAPPSGVPPSRNPPSTHFTCHTENDAFTFQQVVEQQGCRYYKAHTRTISICQKRTTTTAVAQPHKSTAVQQSFS